MTRSAEALGNSPPRSWDSLDAGLVRLLRLYQTDTDTPRSYHSNRLDMARAELLAELREWVRPQVEAEQRARETYEDRIDEQAKRGFGYSLDQPR